MDVYMYISNSRSSYKMFWLFFGNFKILYFRHHLPVGGNLRTRRLPWNVSSMSMDHRPVGGLGRFGGPRTRRLSWNVSSMSTDRRPIGGIRTRRLSWNVSSMSTDRRPIGGIRTRRLSWNVSSMSTDRRPSGCRIWRSSWNVSSVSTDRTDRRLADDPERQRRKRSGIVIDGPI